MTMEQARWRLLFVYEMTTGYRASEATLAEDQRYTKLKEATHGPR